MPTSLMGGRLAWSNYSDYSGAFKARGLGRRARSSRPPANSKYAAVPLETEQMLTVCLSSAYLASLPRKVGAIAYLRAAYTTPAVLLYNDSILPIGVQKENRLSRNAKIAIAVVVPIVTIVLIAALVVFCLKRRRRKRANIAEGRIERSKDSHASLEVHHAVTEDPASDALHSSGPAELGSTGQNYPHEPQVDQPSYAFKRSSLKILAELKLAIRHERRQKCLEYSNLALVRRGNEEGAAGLELVTSDCRQIHAIGSICLFSTARQHQHHLCARLGHGFRLCLRHLNPPTKMSSVATSADSATKEEEIFDIILIVGAENEKLRASSAVLSANSPVFAAMFGPNFSEGQQLRDPSRKDPVQIKLPEDDAHGMRLLNGVLHNVGMIRSGWCYGGWETHISELEKFAVLAAKYMCQDAARSRAGEWIDVQIKRLLGLLDAGASASVDYEFVQVLKAIDLLDDHVRFAYLSNNLGRRGWSLDQAFADAQDDALAPYKLRAQKKKLTTADHYERSKDTAIRKLGDMLDQIGETVLRHTIQTYGASPPGRHRGLQCISTRNLASWLLEELANGQLWPPEKRPATLPALLDRLQCYRTNIVSWRCYQDLWGCLRWNFPGKRLSCTSQSVVSDTHNGIKDAQDFAEKVFVGVLHGCFRGGCKDERGCCLMALMGDVLMGFDADESTNYCDVAEYHVSERWNHCTAPQSRLITYAVYVSYLHLRRHHVHEVCKPQKPPHDGAIISRQSISILLSAPKAAMSYKDIFITGMTISVCTINVID
ncbi:uncharacterized protein MYCFIDRAFT_170185 [Pseudocercospora fijiensis CIRAD86]|uniref:BTB domain-containing protein n=1 Tax=Pseudocercospora fijiensis (strain CIRAD86) TaxID=383855 RepID=N1QBN4_PSEFD|nr:uncharacterized protein MYCFIDRAFT_170185 [Pseudocercospora fijiensis CIRAD86]EME88598.1 hypothetical protein MYCFIDRAFT_170185 [Pseudocercospora fijiensis CIRAD86]